ncbi:hypothetical protein C8J57DRAFT_1075388, partial [Mycena rebaudengoi]
IRWLDCHDRMTLAFAGKAFNAETTIFNGTLPDSFKCGEMDVPMDWAKPFDAETNHITIGFAMNRPKVSSGLLLYHPGGPGEDAIGQAWARALNMTGTWQGLEDFDFLAINSRGLQFSSPLNCTVGDIFADVQFPLCVPLYSILFICDYQTAMKKYFASCAKDSKPEGVLAHIGTAELIQDYDAMRVALGYEKISFTGVSYGTFVGAAYIERFPERVEHFVLDAVIPHGMPYQDLVSLQVGALNRLLERADAFCLHDETCPFFGKGKGTIAAPLPAPGCGPTGNPFCKDPVTATDLRFGVHAFFRSNPDFPAFNQALNASLNGDATGFAYIALQDVRQSVVGPLLCSDFREFTIICSMKVVTLIRPADKHDLIYSQTWQLLYTCAAWPFAVPEQKAFKTDIPILWITSDFDLNTPTEQTTFAHSQTPNAALVVRHGDNHVSIDVAAPANAAQIVFSDFIRTGIMPSTRNDSLITIVPPGGTRAPVSDPYDVPTGALAGDISAIENITTSSTTGLGGEVKSPSAARSLRDVNWLSGAALATLVVAGGWFF